MAPQVRGWTCSVCSLDWLLRATGLNPYSSREQVVGEIGYPGCIDAYSGLKDTQCLVRVLESYGVEARQEWLTYERAWDLASSTALILNSTSWYHFVAVRGPSDAGLAIANSAEGYQGIYDTISYSQWMRWDGSWQAVYLVR
jgi:hypothetical protein